MHRGWDKPPRQQCSQLRGGWEGQEPRYADIWGRWGVGGPDSHNHGPRQATGGVGEGQQEGSPSMR